MTKCKLCKKIINDGVEYCNDCADKKDLVANESYLDDLLNSIQENVPATSEIYKKKKEVSQSDSRGDMSTLQKEESYFDDLNDFDEYDIMKDLDEPNINNDDTLSQDFIEENIDNEFLNVNEVKTESGEDEDKEESPENELLDLLNRFDPDSSIEDDDLRAISELLGGVTTDNQQESGYPEDVGEVFTEALEVISNLSDPDNEIDDITKEPEVIPGEKATKRKKRRKDKKESLLKKIFANIDDDKLDPEKKKAKEEAIVAKIEKKKQKKARSKSEQVPIQEGTEKVSDGRVKDTKTKEDERKKRKEEKQRKKEEKKKKKEQKKAEKNLEIIEDFVEEGRINPVGASIVFVFFGMLVMFLLISTNIFSYSLNIKNATNYFGSKRYTQAYNEVYGIELKDEDIELYDKIMTVMFVNKQLNSYNNYYHIKKYPEALDSLLKGLQRYDKYVELATMLGIKTDLEYVRNQIIAELYSVFSLTEEQATTILNSESQLKYSIAVYDVIIENILSYSTN